MDENNGYKRKHKIRAEIVDRESGTLSYENIKMVRVVSHDHNLLIMEDYLPVIGEVAGRIELIMEDTTITMNPIHGFYMHKKNRFSLLIENHDGTIPKPIR